MGLSRFPVPEPFVFFGDPLKFIEWSTTFKALIERQCLNPADRLFYLQKYIDGEARSILEGSFYRKDEQAYQQAWGKLTGRYGNSFEVQRAFREKLNRWPKIGGSEYVKLREFSDYLQSCSDAMLHIQRSSGSEWLWREPEDTGKASQLGNEQMEPLCHRTARSRQRLPRL